MPSPEMLPTFVLPRERALAKLRAGRPLLHDEPVRLDLEEAAEQFERLAGEHRLDLAPLDVSALLTEAFVQHADHVRQLVAIPGLEAEFIAEIAERAVARLRRAYADRLGTFVDEWHHGYCPICGFSPAADGLVRCQACGFTWRAAAPEPPFRIELALPDEDA